MKRTILPLLCLSLAVFAVGCGKKDDDQATIQAQAGGTFVSAPAPGQPAPSFVAPPEVQGQYPYFYVNYRVDEAGCSTGWRRFSGNDSGYVRALMCQSFRNDQMNQNCGRAQRQQWYATVCQGY